jgi:hypothetical protein
MDLNLPAPSGCGSSKTGGLTADSLCCWRCRAAALRMCCQFNNRSKSATVVGLINYSSSDNILLKPEQERGDWHCFISAPRARPSTMLRARTEAAAGSSSPSTVGWAHESCTVLLAHPSVWDMSSLTLRMTGCKLKVGDRTVECEARRGFRVQMQRSKSKTLPWLISIRDSKPE